jgi:hypothetical protein
MVGLEIPDDLPQRVEDALYVSVGLGVLAVQRAQVRRRELEKLLSRLRGDLQERTTRP